MSEKNIPTPTRRSVIAGGLAALGGSTTVLASSATIPLAPAVAALWSRFSSTLATEAAAVRVMCGEDEPQPWMFDKDNPDAWQQAKQAVQWPTPHWIDNGAWPIQELWFHLTPNDPWPVSHLTPAMGELKFLNYQAFTVVSASSNVVPLTGGAAGTAILAATAGKWCTLVSDGTNWITMQAA